MRVQPRQEAALIAYASQEWCIPISTAERLPAAFVEHAALPEPPRSNPL